jgi:hypothetical protein
MSKIIFPGGQQQKPNQDISKPGFGVAFIRFQNRAFILIESILFASIHKHKTRARTNRKKLPQGQLGTHIRINLADERASFVRECKKEIFGARN